MTIQRAKQIFGNKVDHLSDDQIQGLIDEAKALIFIMYEQTNIRFK